MAITGYVPLHKLKQNFLDYYAEFVNNNKITGNRHLENSFRSFKKFLSGRAYISPLEITEELCERFRNYLLKQYNGETPASYFHRFKRTLQAAKKQGYFRDNPAADIKASTSKNKRIKNILSEQEYLMLMNTPCLNFEVKKAFVFSLYTGLRWVDVKSLQWNDIVEGDLILLQKKTGVILEILLHKIALEIIGKRKAGRVFTLPTQDGANKVLKHWCEDAGLSKHITWHCARHSFSVLLQIKGTDIATVAGMLGHTSTKYVQQTYKRYIKEEAAKAILNLPEKPQQNDFT